MKNEPRTIIIKEESGGTNIPAWLIIGLTLIFTYLKLTHQINWSWWYVTLPVWIFPAIIGGIIITLLAVVILAAVFGGIYCGIYYLIVERPRQKRFEEEREQRRLERAKRTNPNYIPEIVVTTQPRNRNNHW